MNAVAENVIDHQHEKNTRKYEVCPALILAETIVCDAIGQSYQPCNRQMREFCMNESYVRCSLRHSA